MIRYLWEKYSKEELKQFISTSKSLKDFIFKLGYTAYRTKIKNEIIKKYPDLQEPLFFLSHGGENLIGKKFSKLTVISLNLKESEKQHHRCWNCVCDCGRKTVVRGGRLTSGEIQSCLNCSKRANLANQKFGLLTPLYIDENLTKLKNDYRVYWYCQCDCGNHKIVSSHDLVQGTTSTCGCKIISKGEKKIAQILLENDISFKTQFTFSDLKSSSGRVLRFDFALIDKNEAPKILIEYQGIQHYIAIERFGGEETFIKQKERDQLKRQYCEEHNLLLIEIPYKDFNNISLEYLNNKAGVDLCLL